MPFREGTSINSSCKSGHQNTCDVKRVEAHLRVNWTLDEVFKVK